VREGGRWGRGKERGEWERRGDGVEGVREMKWRGRGQDYLLAAGVFLVISE
jgi:hypothetical protein